MAESIHEAVLARDAALRSADAEMTPLVHNGMLAAW